MTKLRNIFMTLLAPVLVGACSAVSPTAAQLAFPAFATQQVALNPQTSAPSVVLTSTPEATNTTPPGPSTSIPPYSATPSHSDILGIHIVRTGEWLYCIGRAYRVLPSAIAKANGLVSPDKIVPNQRLNIPNAPWTNSPAGPVCIAQFTVPGSSPPSTPTPTPAALVMNTIIIPPVTPCPDCFPPPISIPYAELTSFDLRTECQKNISSSHTDSGIFHQTDNVYVLWIEKGMSGPDDELSLAVYQNEQLLGSGRFHTAGNGQCRSAAIPFTTPGEYKAILSLNGMIQELHWSIR
jgi:LysM repeat protein